LQKVPQIQPDRRPDERAEQGTGTADHRLHHQLARSIEAEGIGRHVALQDTEQPARKPTVGGGDDEDEQLVAVHVVPHCRGAQRIVADGGQDAADRRLHDAARDQQSHEIAAGDEAIHGPAALNRERCEAQRKGGRRHARQAVLAAREIRERRILEKEKYLSDRHGDHSEIDPGTPQRDQSDAEPAQRRRQHAESQAEHHAGDARARQQIGRGESAGAEERRLAERQESRVAEQQIETDPEQPQHEDAAHRVGSEAEPRQDRRRGDECDCGRKFRQPPAMRREDLRRGHVRHSAPSKPRGRSMSTTVMTANRAT
jgi:hypothetical protein